jgi:NAD-dependent SIR2 family protein deacetylase
MMDFEKAFAECAEALRWADGLLITAGAGIGVDSGLPDFRGDDGFWNAYPGLREAKIDFRSIATPDSFRTNPRLAWGFYGHRLKLYRESRPHPGFAILQEFARSMQQGYFVFTSNVDGHFQAAGFPHGRVHECHGSIHYLQCLDDCEAKVWSAEGFLPEINVQNCRLLNDFPTCPVCCGIARPNILMFHDMDWQELPTLARREPLEQWLAGIGKLLVIEIGAGTGIARVRHFSESRKGFLIRINPREACLPDRCRGISIALPALEALTKIRAAWISS